MEITDLKKLEKLPYFTKNALRSLVEESDNTLNQSVKRFLAVNKIFKIKNGVYVTERFYLENKSNGKYLEYLSFVLKPNSYLSIDYVLSKFNVITDATYGFYSMTTNGTIKYKNVFGSYSYKNIKNELFTGFKEEYFLNNKYYIATKAKALFDYLYLRQSIINLDSNNLIEDLRLNLASFAKADINEFTGYSKLLKKDNSKIVSIVKKIENEYVNI